MDDVTEQMAEEIPRLLRDLEAATDPAAVDAYRAEQLAPFSETGPWRYAPAAEKAAAARAVDDALAQRSGEALYRLEHQTEAFKRQLLPLLHRAQEPLSVEAVHVAQADVKGISREYLTQLETLDEMRRSRFHVELSPLTPSQLLARYERALETPTDQESASLIRVVESRHRDGWTGIDVGHNVAEAELIGKLKTRIAAARASRVPAWLTACRVAIEAAEVKAAETKTFRRVRSARPAAWKVA